MVSSKINQRELNKQLNLHEWGLDIPMSSGGVEKHRIFDFLILLWTMAVRPKFEATSQQ